MAKKINHKKHHLLFIVAMVGKKAVEVDFKRAEVGFLKTDSFKKALFLLVFNRAFIECVVNTAKVDKIKSSSAEHKESFKIKGIDSGGDVINETALCGKLKLRYTAQLTVYGSGVGKQIGLEFNTA